MSKTLLPALTLLLPLWVGQAMGEPWNPRDAGGGPLMLARDYSLDDAVSGVRRRNEGKVLSADTVDEDGRPVHRIRILSDQGRVRGLRFDGATGRPLPPPGGQPSSRRYPR
jgi:hypothetical protein